MKLDSQNFETLPAKIKRLSEHLTATCEISQEELRQRMHDAVEVMIMANPEPWTFGALLT